MGTPKLLDRLSLLTSQNILYFAGQTLSNSGFNTLRYRCRIEGLSEFWALRQGISNTAANLAAGCAYRATVAAGYLLSEQVTTVPNSLRLKSPDCLRP